MKFLPTAEGYYNFENNKYIYSYTDHLGNVRLSYFKNQSGSAGVLEENNYYPFGLKHEGYNPTQGNPYYKYEYNGHELQTETGWSDFGFRQYMPDIGRFGVIDPLADTTLQAYSFASNNPIFNIDFLGLLSTPPTGSNGYSIGQVWTDGEGWWKRINGGWKNTKSDETVIDEVEVGGGGGAAGSSLGGIIAGAIVTMGDSVNNMLTQAFFGIGSNRSMHNYQQNLSRFQLAVMNNKGAREVEEFENFLFLELPASFAGGELLSLGWRASGIGKVLASQANKIFTVASSGGGETLPMTIEKIIPKGTKIADVINEIKGLTWSTGNEHAVVKLANGQKAIVSGGPGGISFEAGQIRTLFGHTHPTAAPPSAADFRALKILNQAKQYVFHGGETTLIRP